MIERGSVEAVEETAAEHIVEIVGDYVQLRRRGANYMGCCPFHSEKTPSFSVSAAKGYCYCFGCHKGGSAVSFVMQMEHMSFPDAIRSLGKRFGVEVRETERTSEQAERQAVVEGLSAANEYAAKWYESSLRAGEGEALGLSYLRHRGFRDDVIGTFRLGYAPAGPDALLRQALADGYKLATLTAAGLTAGDESHPVDRFRGRVMFPFLSHTGKVVGFGGRVLDQRTKGVNVKYLNTPETELYHKGETLYGLFQARTEISKRDKCLLVEGYTDVLSLHQAGLRNAVGSSGTALTVNQIRLIHRYTDNITVLYDGDNAGQHAALRGIDLILGEGLNVRVAALPPDEDPDSFAQKHNEEELLAWLGESEQDFIRYKGLQLRGSSDPQTLAAGAESIVGSIACVPDPLRREIYIRQCSELLGLSEASLVLSLQKALASRAAERRDEAVRETRVEARRPIAAAGAAGATPKDVEYRELMRLLVTYSQHRLERLSGSPTVGDYILEALQVDELHSREPNLEALVELYRQAPNRELVGFRQFLSVGDPVASSFVASTEGDRPALSRLHNKYSPVEPEEALLDTLVPRAIDQLRLRRVQEMIAAAEQALKSGGADTTECLQRLMDLNGVKQELSREMGERAVLS